MGGLAKKLIASSGGEEKLYVDDVFSTYLYTGNGSTQTINNGIDLAGKGGLVWTKVRNTTENHWLVDTERGQKGLSTNTTSAQANLPTFTFTSTGFYEEFYVANTLNVSTHTFRKAPKFFDIVTYTGDGTIGRQIPHNLGVVPGFVIIKSTDSVGNWSTWHRGSDALIATGGVVGLRLNSTASGYTEYDYTHVINNMAAIPTSSTISIKAPSYAGEEMNNPGTTYVAYLFAHDPSPDGIIQAGSYTGNGSTTGPVIDLGWEPQYLLIKNTSGTGNWQIIDSMRGMNVGSADATLQANLTNVESSVDYVSPTSTGFQITSTSSEVNTTGATYIYLAIRRPNKPPTSGTEVFSPVAYSGDSTANRVLTTGFAPDAVIISKRSSSRKELTASLLGWKELFTNTTDAESNYSAIKTASTGLSVSVTGHFNMAVNTTGETYIAECLRRAPGFFDVVAYTGNGGTKTVAHSLGVTPELIITKNRINGSANWIVFLTELSQKASLDSGAGFNTTALSVFFGDNTNYIPPTDTQYTVGEAAYVNGNNNRHVAYLFASLDGISKIGSYTGNGTSQTINCGFTTGARFVLVKRTDNTGNWYVWDTARGIVADNDPRLSLNTTAAEVTTDDSVDPESTGFIVNQNAATNINVNGASYIYLAIA